MMNSRIPLSPVGGVRESGLDLFPTYGLSEFVRSWPDLQKDCSERRGNRALGLALAVGVSAAFWIGLGLLLARLW
jgi:hypothetical protein